ncbi:hypothetical protein SADUNF_Sadunf03G0152500 [Salix dunnii]|uniref:ABC transmembrane type-1 domain-containing protein n=1 Tax=Salix dunnii TaxID=1413687 RepID=A0A835N500_9ROSI|nr:hypothetical protein SADUNF_Sadunf03G0152500 [Salix dunnii]
MNTIVSIKLSFGRLEEKFQDKLGFLNSRKKKHGKSILLSFILGELPKISGTLRLCGTKSCVVQSPWIQSAKIEENILFGKEMDRERYDKIVRALYQDVHIYLFDDPFSVVNAHTGSHMFKYDDILHSGSDFMVLVGAYKAALLVLDSRQAGPVSENESVRDNNGGENNVVVEPQTQLIQEEEREKGSVGIPIYWKYITTVYGGALMPFILLAQLLFQILQVGSTYWMAWETPASNDGKPVVSGSKLSIVYVSLVIGSSFFILAYSMLLITAGYRTATPLFNKLHLCIFRAPMSFFDTTPHGLILNRVSNFNMSYALCIGLVVAYALDLHMAQVELIWNFCNLENKLISVHRILQSIPDDPPLFN